MKYRKNNTEKIMQIATWFYEVLFHFTKSIKHLTDSRICEHVICKLVKN